jgi:ribosomal protein S18 acetylase RimI-like enzyme
MRVIKLSSPDDFERYIDFAKEVYRDNPHWVPGDKHHLIQLLSGDAGFGPQSEIQAFAVEHEGRTLATVAAFRDEAYDRHWNEKLGQLLFFEALPDQNEAVEALIGEACEWLRERDYTSARLGMLPGVQLPLTIDAYDTVPTCFHSYNPPYYHSYIKNCGFVTERGVVQYQVQFTAELEQRYREMVQRARDAGVVVRSWDFDRLEEESAAFAALGNETFSAHFGFMPLPDAVMRGFTVEFKDLLIPELLGFAEVDGQRVGFVYSLPDLNQALHPMRDKVLEENFPEFVERFARVDHGVLLIIGVKEEYRGRGINLALAAHSYLGMIERGYKTASYTVVMDDNWPSRRTAEKLGARVTRNFVVYRRDLSRSTHDKRDRGSL